MEIPLTNGFYVSDSLPLSHQQCINLIPVVQQQQTLSQRQLIGSAGIRQILTTGNDANRGSWDLSGVPYLVNGSALYRIDRAFPDGVETFTAVDLSAAETPAVSITGTGRVSMADNGTQLMVLVPGSPSTGYIYSVAGGLIEITDPDFSANGEPQYVVFIDGYFACSTDSKKWIISALNDGTSWDALDFGSAESDPDAIVAPIVYNNQIYLTGSETTEGFQNIGGAGFPFQRSNIFLDKGCYAPFTLVATNQRFFMVGGGKDEDPAIWMFQGNQFQKISTNAIDTILSSYSDSVVNAAFALSWAKRGQYFVSFTFTDRTLVFNMTTGLWHEQKSGIPNSDGDLVQSAWRVNSLVSAYGYTIVGDAEDGRVGILDTELLSEYDNNLIRLFNPPVIANGGNPFRMPMIELTIESGIGDLEVEDPQISMALSKDGKTFNYERNRSMGKIGEYGRRVVWRKNGRFPRFCVPQFRISDPIKPVVMKLEANIT